MKINLLIETVVFILTAMALYKQNMYEGTINMRYVLILLCAVIAMFISLSPAQ